MHPPPYSARICFTARRTAEPATTAAFSKSQRLAAHSLGETKEALMGLFKTDLFRSFGLGFAVGAAGFFAISGGVFSDPAASLITPAHAASVQEGAR